MMKLCFYSFWLIGFLCTVTAKNIPEESVLLESSESQKNDSSEVDDDDEKLDLEERLESERERAEEELESKEEERENEKEGKKLPTPTETKTEIAENAKNNIEMTPNALASKSHAENSAKLNLIKAALTSVNDVKDLSIAPTRFNVGSADNLDTINSRSKDDSANQVSEVKQTLNAKSVSENDLQTKNLETQESGNVKPKVASEPKANSGSKSNIVLEQRQAYNGDTSVDLKSRAKSEAEDNNANIDTKSIKSKSNTETEAEAELDLEQLEKNEMPKSLVLKSREKSETENNNAKVDTKSLQPKSNAETEAEAEADADLELLKKNEAASSVTLEPKSKSQNVLEQKLSSETKSLQKKTKINITDDKVLTQPSATRSSDNVEAETEVETDFDIEVEAKTEVEPQINSALKSNVATESQLNFKTKTGLPGENRKHDVDIETDIEVELQSKNEGTTSMQVKTEPKSLTASDLQPIGGNESAVNNFVGPDKIFLGVQTPDTPLNDASFKGAINEVVSITSSQSELSTKPENNIFESVQQIQNKKDFFKLPEVQNTIKETTSKIATDSQVSTKKPFLNELKKHLESLDKGDLVKRIGLEPQTKKAFRLENVLSSLMNNAEFRQAPTITLPLSDSKSESAGPKNIGPIDIIDLSQAEKANLMLDAIDQILQLTQVSPPDTNIDIKNGKEAVGKIDINAVTSIEKNQIQTNAKWSDSGDYSKQNINTSYVKNYGVQNISAKTNAESSRVDDITDRTMNTANDPWTTSEQFTVVLTTIKDLITDLASGSATIIDIKATDAEIEVDKPTSFAPLDIITNAASTVADLNVRTINDMTPTILISNEVKSAPENSVAVEPSLIDNKAPTEPGANVIDVVTQFSG